MCAPRRISKRASNNVASVFIAEKCVRPRACNKRSSNAQNLHTRTAHERAAHYKRARVEAREVKGKPGRVVCALHGFHSCVCVCVTLASPQPLSCACACACALVHFPVHSPLCLCHTNTLNNDWFLFARGKNVDHRALREHFFPPKQPLLCFRLCARLRTASLTLTHVLHLPFAVRTWLLSSVSFGWPARTETRRVHCTHMPRTSDFHLFREPRASFPSRTFLPPRCVLRSASHFTQHTKHAVRIWRGTAQHRTKPNSS